MELRDQYRGSLLGLAVGDALGTTLEFSQPGSFAPVEEMVGGGPFALKPGEWTNDTSMALCLAASLVERHGQLAGAFYGEEAFPQHWRARLAHRSLIESLADQLFDLSRMADAERVGPLNRGEKP